MSESRTSIAVVDDDASFSRAICRLLRAAGFNSVSYPSAESFLASNEPTRPACLVLDIHLGEMSGLELQQRLRALGDATPIVFVTAHDEADAREQALNAGCSGYFRKPVHRDQLLEAIRDAVREQPPTKHPNQNSR